METKENIPPQEDVAHLSPWTHSKLLGEEKLTTTNFPSSSETQRSQLETSFSRLEYCGAPQNLSFAALPPKAQRCAILLCSDKLVNHSLFPLTHQRAPLCCRSLRNLLLTLTWGSQFCFMFPSFWAFIFKVPHTQPESLRSLSGAIQRALHRAGGGSCSKLRLCIRQRGADSNPKRSLHLPVVGSHIQKTLTKNKGYLDSVITETLEAMLFLTPSHTEQCLL